MAKPNSMPRQNDIFFGGTSTGTHFSWRAVPEGKVPLDSKFSKVLRKSVSWLWKKSGDTVLLSILVGCCPLNSPLIFEVNVYLFHLNVYNIFP